MSDEWRQDGFPETDLSVLREAARGTWARFLEQYLKSCWREVAFACRQARIPVTDDDDLFQELILRVITDGRFSPRLRELMQEAGEQEFRGNLPAKYLKYRDLPLASVRFRTYLKGLIRNVIREAARRRRDAPRSLDETGVMDRQAWLDESITRSLDRRRVIDCLEETARSLRDESERARTKGAQRLFLVLALSVVRRCSTTEIAERLQLDRTTASGLLKRARRRFVELLKQISGIEDPQELKAALSAAPAALSEAFVRASRQRQAGGEGDPPG